MPELPSLPEDLLSALESMVWQFAYRVTANGRAALSAGGLSALEEAFAALDWEDPRPVPEAECQAPDCHDFATCGANTAQGYKRMCGAHYRELGLKT